VEILGCPMVSPSCPKLSAKLSAVNLEDRCKSTTYVDVAENLPGSETPEIGQPPDNQWTTCEVPFPDASDLCHHRRGPPDHRPDSPCSRSHAAGNAGRGGNGHLHHFFPRQVRGVRPL